MPFSDAQRSDRCRSHLHLEGSGMGGKAEPPGAERLFDFPGRSRVDLPWSSCESAASLFRNMALDVFQPDGEGHATSDRVHSRIDHEAGPLGPWSRRLARGAKAICRRQRLRLSGNRYGSGEWRRNEQIPHLLLVTSTWGGCTIGRTIPCGIASEPNRK